MKNIKIVSMYMLLVFTTALVAQNPALKVGLNPTSINSSAVLDAESTTKGLLPPRMTTAQRNAIASPAKGLIVYDISLDCLMVNKGTSAAPNWECIGASAAPSLVVDCGASSFVSSSPATDPLCNGLFIGRSGYQVSFVLTNNSFSAISNMDLSTAVTLSGAGAAGLSVTAGQNTSVSVASAGSVTLTYNLTGSPTTAGSITATFTRLGLTCAISKTVVDPATWVGNSLNGTSSANANVSCLAIKNAFPSSTNGQYWIDPDGTCTAYSAMQVYCDMTTDGGGWTLIAINWGSYYTYPLRTTLTNQDTMGYLSRPLVIQLSNNSSTVQLRAGNSSTSYAYKTTSTANGLAIQALRSASTAHAGAGTWHNGAYATFTANTGSWCWSVSAAVTSIITGWPNMYHASGYAGCVHWFDGGGNYNNGGLPWSGTYIR